MAELNGSSEGMSWSQEAEIAIDGLPERLAVLRREGMGKPIAVGKIGENGQLSAEIRYVGHILPIDETGRWHVIIFDNGQAAHVGAQYGSDLGYDPRYSKTYSGTEPLLYPEGKTKREIFQDLTVGYRPHGGAVYSSSDNPSSQKGLEDAINKSFELVRRTIEDRRNIRQSVGTTVIDAVNKALGNKF